MPELLVRGSHSDPQALGCAKDKFLSWWHSGSRNWVGGGGAVQSPWFSWLAFSGVEWLLAELRWEPLGPQYFKCTTPRAGIPFALDVWAEKGTPYVFRTLSSIHPLQQAPGLGWEVLTPCSTLEEGSVWGTDTVAWTEVVTFLLHERNGR